MEMRGMFFTMDAMFALMIIVAIIPIFMLISISTVPPEVLHQRLHLQAADAVNLMSEIKTVDLMREPVILNYYNKGILDDNDMNMPLIDTIAMLWSSNNISYTEAAANITDYIFSKVMPNNIKWGIFIENETIYSKPGDITRTVAISKKLMSGYMKGKPSSGYISKASLNKISGKRTASYSFFGGFVGEGNITTVIGDIPKNSTMRFIYMEMNVGNNFSLYINNNLCGNFIKTSGRLAVNNWTITNPVCLGFINPGENNTIVISFTGNNLSEKFIGGGYIKIVYDTTDMVILDTGIVKNYMPGIYGVMNLFSSFYVPGALNSINVYLHYLNNASNTKVFLNIGNITIYESSATGEQHININNTNISTLLNSYGITYNFLSNNTVPIRFGTRGNGTAGYGNADVILITDGSDAMKYRLDSDLPPTGTGRKCDNVNLYDPDTRRYDLAKCLDSEFVDIILSNKENRVGLVYYDKTIKNFHDLSNDNSSLQAQIRNYVSGSPSKSICLALRKARLMLQQQSSPERQKFIVLMTGGLADMQCDPEDNLTGCIAPPCPDDPTCTDGDCSYEVAEKVSGSQSKPAIAFFNNKWIMVAGESGGTFKGYEWRNNTWFVNSSLVLGLGDVGSYSAPAIAFNITGNGKWILISGSSSGTLAGFDWNGVQWVSNNSLVSGLVGMTKDSAPAIAFNITGDGKWNLISGSSSGYYGFYWNGVQWVSNNSLVSGLGSSGSTPALAFNVTGNGKWNLISGTGSGFVGFYWTGINWTSDPALVSGLEDPGSQSAPTLAFNLLENTWYLVTGLSTGQFYSYYWGVNRWYTICGQDLSMKAMSNAIEDGCKAHDRANATIYTVGFGPVAYCKIAEVTLKSIAACGNGEHYASANASELKIIYEHIADEIVSLTYEAQTITVEGVGENNTLYPDSYIEVNYTKPYVAPEYKEISINIETDKFGGCNGSFFVPSQLSKIDDVKLTSFSGDYWTQLVSVNSSMTGGWKNIYNLSEYGTVYIEMGDPYVIHIPKNLIASDETNHISSILAAGPSNISSNCSLNNRVIYTAKLKAYTFYSNISPQAWGSRVRVFFDKNYDGYAEGSVVIDIGKDLPIFDPTEKTVDELEPENNAVDYAFMELLKSLNFFTMPGNSGSAGSETNPIDIELSDVMTIETLSVGGIQYMWGPIGVGVKVWV